ncbi:MAG: zinc ribbon domain-containing protein [Phycisphaerales bacterium JB060]
MTMTETDRLLKVFRVDNSIDGLQGRLRAAERFLAEQEKQLASIEDKHKATQAELRKTKAAAANAEGEAKRLEGHITELREKMNSAGSNKEYQAYLAEITTFKSQQEEQESIALELLNRIETLSDELSELGKAKDERQGVRTVALKQRDERNAEIAERLEELKSERETIIAEVPEHTLTHYLRVRGQLGDEAMAPVEVVDVKRHEFVCGTSMLAVPIETVSALLSHGRLTMDPQSGAILYLSDEARKAMEPAGKR